MVNGDLPDIMKSSKEVPTLKLKPLLEDLKYVFLSPIEGTFPVVISSHFTLKQEANLLTVLRQHREAIGWTIARVFTLQSVPTIFFWRETRD
jgi:hypothetical protein